MLTPYDKSAFNEQQYKIINRIRLTSGAGNNPEIQWESKMINAHDQKSFILLNAITKLQNWSPSFRLTEGGIRCKTERHIQTALYYMNEMNTLLSLDHTEYNERYDVPL